MVVPDGEDENVTLGKGLAHRDEATPVLESRAVAEGALLSIAELVGDGVITLEKAGEVGFGIGVDLAILNPEATDLDKVSGAGTIVGDELGDNSEGPGCVNDLSRAIEIPVAETVGVVVAAVSVAETGIAITNSAIRTRATLEAAVVGGPARMGGVGRAHRVGLPNIHLRAAGSVLSGSCVFVGRRRGPTLNVSLCRGQISVLRQSKRRRDSPLRQ